MTPEEEIEAGLAMAESGLRRYAEEVAPDDGRPVELPTRELRWRAHVLACSINDMTFWVECNGLEGEQRRWRATEVETGMSAAWRRTARGAMDAYWNGEFFDQSDAVPQPADGARVDPSA